MTGDQPKQSTTTTLSSEQQQILGLALPNAQQFAAAPLKAYPGETVAGFTPTQTKAQSDILAGAGGAGDIADWSTGGVTGLTGTLAPGATTTTPFVSTNIPTSSNIFSDPGIWNPDYNAGLSNAITAAQRPTWQALTETALPAIRSGAVTAGGYGGSEGYKQGNLATSRAFQTASDQAAKMAEDVYGANLGAVNQRYATNIGAENQRYAEDVARYGTDVAQRNQTLNALLSAYGMAPSLQQQGLVPGYTEASVGDVQQQQQQAYINEALQKYNFNQMAPAEKAQFLVALLGGIPGGTTTSTGTTPTPNPVTGALGGAASGAALGSIIPGVGTVVGAGVGGLAGTLPFLLGRG